tara:strand:- start:429 stop:593 length:165 start_codon:yes stop_codon:yes gene_type:complete
VLNPVNQGIFKTLILESTPVTDSLGFLDANPITWEKNSGILFGAIALAHPTGVG